MISSRKTTLCQLAVAATAVLSSTTTAFQATTTLPSMATPQTGRITTISTAFAPLHMADSNSDDDGVSCTTAAPSNGSTIDPAIDCAD